MRDGFGPGGGAIAHDGAGLGGGGVAEGLVERVAHFDADGGEIAEVSHAAVADVAAGDGEPPDNLIGDSAAEGGNLSEVGEHALNRLPDGDEGDQGEKNPRGRRFR